MARSVADLPISAQLAFQEVHDKIDRLRRDLSALDNDSEFQQKIDELRREMVRATINPEFSSWEQVFGSPDAVSGAAIRMIAGAGRGVSVVTDAAGEWPLPGFTPIDKLIGGPFARTSINKFNLLGSLFIQGALRVSQLEVDRMHIFGVPHCVLTHSIDQSFGAGPVVGALTFDTELANNGNCHSLVTNPNRITVPVGMDGMWAMWCNFRYQGSNTGFRRNCNIRVDGATVVASGECTVGGSAAVMDVGCYRERFLRAGQYLECLANHDATIDLNVLATAGNVETPIFGARWLSD